MAIFNRKLLVYQGLMPTSHVPQSLLSQRRNSNIFLRSDPAVVQLTELVSRHEKAMGFGSKSRAASSAFTTWNRAPSLLTPGLTSININPLGGELPTNRLGG